MSPLFEYISAIGTFLIVSVAIWWLLDVRLYVLRPFDYKPFNCRKCLTFWTLAAISAAALIEGHNAFGVTLAVLASLNAAAMEYDERQNG